MAARARALSSVAVEATSQVGAKMLKAGFDQSSQDFGSNMLFYPMYSHQKYDMVWGTLTCLEACLLNIF